MFGESRISMKITRPENTCECGKISNFYSWARVQCCSFYRSEDSIYINGHGKFNLIGYYITDDYIEFWDKSGSLIKEINDCNFENVEELISFVNKYLENLEFL